LNFEVRVQSIKWNLFGIFEIAEGSCCLIVYFKRRIKSEEDILTLEQHITFKVYWKRNIKKHFMFMLWTSEPSWV
jgi:tRNA A58 N-methylase Trm61